MVIPIAKNNKVVKLAIILIFDGEAKNVPCPEASTVIHASVKQRMGIGILDVQDLSCGCYVTSNTLISWDPKLIL